MLEKIKQRVTDFLCQNHDGASHTTEIGGWIVGIIVICIVVINGLKAFFGGSFITLITDYVTSLFRNITI